MFYVMPSCIISDSETRSKSRHNLPIHNPNKERYKLREQQRID